ncbi:MAG: NAD(P)H-hydrate dehydratase [Deltaproteobacteria bacterium]|jgi:NAD(P)H-hydrate epimerase|nr:NAD(P)H-hydrate dehydratase [Deltaproteobacteria bacterium]
MLPYPPYVATALESATIDKTAIESFLLPGAVLMENAARSVARHALALFPTLREPGKRIIILAGPGQNGGDGWVLARLFHALGHQVRGYLVAAPGAAPTGDAFPNYQTARLLNIPLSTISHEGDLLPAFNEADFVIDALFGTGLAREIGDPQKRVLEALRDAPRTFKVVAVDVPSGLCATTGALFGPAVAADLTVSLGTYKAGLFSGNGPKLAGLVRLGDIGLSPPMLSPAPLGILLTKEYVSTLLPLRPRDGHKGTFGHAVVAGGSPGKTGALTLAALGALRAGAGLVTAAHPKSFAAIFAQKLTAIMTLPLDESPGAALGQSAADALLEFMGNKSALGLGCGMGLSESAASCALTLAARLPLPLVLDADALTLLAPSPRALLSRAAPTVLTPHYGEAARLLSVSSAEIARDQLESSRQIARERGAIVVLKGPRTIIARPDGRFFVNDSGSPILATGGSGDLLTGLITGLLAQKMDPFKACALAVYAHGLAGEIAAEAKGPWGLSPWEIQEFIPRAFQELRDFGEKRQFL